MKSRDFRTLRLLTMAPAALLAGCGALEQAPLVYASKVAVGIDASTTSTETPGVSLTLGYKQVDTAYVPVAVARACKTGSAQDCRDSAFAIVPLSGNNDVNDQTKPSEQALTDAKAAVDKASAEVAARQQALQAADQAVDSTAKERDGKKAIADSTPDGDAKTPALAAADTARKAAEEAAITQAGAKKALEGAQATLGAAASTYSKLTAPAASASSNTRRDAFSVYGSFDSKNKVESSAIGLNLGRTFSTGVASQNLTEGVRSSACLTAATQTIEVAKDKVDTETLKALITLCTVRTH